MTTLNLKPTHKPIRDYYNALDQFDQLGFTHETAVRSAFQSLLHHCGRNFNWTLVPEYSMSSPDKSGSRPVGTVTRGARGVKNKRIVIGWRVD